MRNRQGADDAGLRQVGTRRVRHCPKRERLRPRPQATGNWIKLGVAIICRAVSTLEVLSFLHELLERWEKRFFGVGSWPKKKNGCEGGGGASLQRGQFFSENALHLRAASLVGSDLDFQAPLQSRNDDTEADKAHLSSKTAVSVEHQVLATV